MNEGTPSGSRYKKPIMTVVLKKPHLQTLPFTFFTVPPDEQTVHLVGPIILIYYDAQSTEHQIKVVRVCGFKMNNS
jgi:hypothetical protein